MTMSVEELGAMELVEARGDINLSMTLESGQVFHWREVGPGYAGVIGSRGVYVEQAGGGILCEKGTGRMVAHYFALDHDLGAIRATFPEDETMREAAAYCEGVRILRQPAWECLATFMTTTQKQVAHIRAMSAELRRRYGKCVDDRFGGLYSYPEPEVLAEAGEPALRECGLGYRAKFLAQTARFIASGGVDLDAIRGMGDGEARAELCKLPGVGVKVANCVLLFAYERLSAFPVDVWIERVLRGIYLRRRRRKVTSKVMAAFAAQHFGPFGGYAQQYLFHHARRTWKNKSDSRQRELRNE